MNLQTGQIDGGRLQSFIERAERIQEEIKALKSDLNEVFAEAKSAGYDVKTMKQIIRLRSKDPADLEEENTMLEIYIDALGMLVDTPLGQAAIKKAS